MHALPAGAYELLIENAGTGDYRVFVLTSPANQTLDHTLSVNFYGPSSVEERVVTHRQFTVEPYTVGRRQVTVPQSPQTVYVYPVQPKVEEKRQGPSRDKVRLRNTILGVGALNEVFNEAKNVETFARVFSVELS